MNHDDVKAVKVGCPLCRWVSMEIKVEIEPNGVWFALKKAGEQWHPHFQNAHKPAPTKILIMKEQSD